MFACDKSISKLATVGPRLDWNLSTEDKKDDD